MNTDRLTAPLCKKTCRTLSVLLLFSLSSWCCIMLLLSAVCLHVRMDDSFTVDLCVLHFMVIMVIYTYIYIHTRLHFTEWNWVNLRDGTRFLCYEIYMCLQNRDRGGFSRLPFLNGAMILHLMSAGAQEERPVSAQAAFQCSNTVWHISGQHKSFIPSIWHGDGHLTEERESLWRQSPKIINVSSKSLLKSSRGRTDSTSWAPKWQSGLMGVCNATLSYNFSGNWNQKNMIIDFFTMLLCTIIQKQKSPGIKPRGM